MTRTGKIPAGAGIEHRVCCSGGGRLNHQANEAVDCQSFWPCGLPRREWGGGGGVVGGGGEGEGAD